MSGYMLKFIAAITAVLSLTACSANVKNEQSDMPHITDSKTADTVAPISVEITEKYNYNNPNEELKLHCSIDYCELNVGGDFKAAYTELENAFESFNADFKNKSDNELEAMSSETEKYADIEDYVRLEKKYASKIRRADSSVVSIANELTEYVVQNLGLTAIFGVSFDSQSGKKLSIDDIANDRAKLAEAVKVQAGKFDIQLPFDDKSIEVFLSSENCSWTVDYNGITFYFNPSGKSGKVDSVTVDFADYKEIFNEKYISAPKAYFASISVQVPYYYDFDGDGKLDKFEMISETDDYDNYAYVSQTIKINNSSLTESDLYCYNFYPMLLHTENGNNYIYLQRAYDNDYHDITVYDVNENGIKQLDTISSGFHYKLKNAENYEVAQDFPYDPGSFKLDTKTDVLSTVTGVREYFADNHGIPSPKKDWYLFDSNNQPTLTLLEDVKASQLDNGTESGSITLKKGSKVLYCGTDNKKTAYLALDDGTRAAVKIDSYDWPRTIDGASIEDLFDGIMFAG